jgi:putative endonuclease
VQFLPWPSQAETQFLQRVGVKISRVLAEPNRPSGIVVAQRQGMQPPTAVYLLRSCSQPERWYTGLTANVHARLATHNRGDSRHTSSGRPWRLEVVIQFASAGAARSFEAYLKTGSGRAFSRRHFREAGAGTKAPRL